MKRPLYKGLGFLAVGLGAVGAALPIMPTVPFLLLAVYFFARSSPELEQKILDHPHWGPHVKDWRERRAISRRSKTMAIGDDCEVRAAHRHHGREATARSARE